MLSYSSLDNPWEPHSGTTARYELQWAGGVLGGDANYLKQEVDLKQYVSLFWDTVFSMRARGGHVQGLNGEDIPVFERFALGGINSVRGFDWRSIGPKDTSVIVDPITDEILYQRDEVIGGDKFALFNVEYVFPIAPAFKFNGVLFFDAGNAWDTDEAVFSSKLRTSAGGGIRWNSPMGPIRLEYAVNLKPEEDEKSTKWEFALGGFF